MNNKILIIGSGWLGAPLAQHLNLQGYQVTATTTHVEKCNGAPQGLPLIMLNTKNKVQTFDSLAALSPSTMIIAIPPTKNNSDYFESLMVLSEAATSANVERVIFISSSSVWGKNTGTVDEQSSTTPTTDSAKAMSNFEQHIQSQSNFCATTLRLTGLFNQQRHPGRFLAGRDNLANPDAPVNMIHQLDCIGLISRIVEQQHWQDVYIGCAPSHPTRKEFYTYGASQLGLTVPKFVATGGHDSKTICGKATADALDYEYIYPDIIKALNC